MIFFSTHRFDMVEKLCSRVVVLSSGRVVLQQRVADFARSGSRVARGDVRPGHGAGRLSCRSLQRSSTRSAGD